MEKGISTLIFQILILLFFVSFKVSAIEITSVNFFQKSDESKLVIEFDSDKIQSERFHVVDDKQIILDIKNATAGDKVMRELDTSEFSGTVVFISPYKKPSTETDIRFAIQLRDNVRSILTQQGKKLILSIENRYGVFSQKKIDENTRYATDKKILKEDDATKLNIPKSNKLEDILENLILSGPKKYVGKKISLNVQNLSIDDVLKIIADSSGFNIILDQSVKSAPPLTLALNNLPWDQVLDTILELAKLVAIKNGNILIITTLEKATAERKLLVEAEQLNRVREPLITKIFPISFATIAEMQTILKEYITTRGSISADERTNSFIIKDVAESLERIKKIIETLDTETPQILIESKIIEANSTFRKQFGLSQGIQFGYDPVKPIPETAVGPGFVFSTVSDYGGSSNNALGVSIDTFKRLTGLDFSLKMMESESKGKIVSSPRVIAQNKKKASLTSTETRSFVNVVTSADTGAPSTEITQVSIDLNLNVTPQVTNDGSIILSIQLSKGGFGAPKDAGTPPDITNRQLNTTVLVDNGSTIVIGGIYSFNKTESHNGIPFLKDIPILGWLFRTYYNPQVDKNELIIFLTPRVINQEEAGLVNRDDSLT